MTSVGVALVNGVRVPGYLFAPGFVGDGSLLTNVHTSNVTHANTGQLAYYVNSTTIGGNPGLSFENDTLVTLFGVLGLFNSISLSSSFYFCLLS